MSSFLVGLSRIVPPTFIDSSFSSVRVRHAPPNDGGVQQQLNDSLMLNNANKTRGNKEGVFSLPLKNPPWIQCASSYVMALMVNLSGDKAVPVLWSRQSSDLVL